MLQQKQLNRPFLLIYKCPLQEVLDKTVIFFHDESTFQANEDQSTFWGVKGTVVMKPKSKGLGIMVSNFIDEKMDISV